ESYINQKQVGAYYTRADITEYIAGNTILPFVFDVVGKHLDGSIWNLLRDNPDQYIYEPVRKGVDLPLPRDIALGLDDVSKRRTWNHLADSAYALPAETWREHVARRRRSLELRARLRAGAIRSMDDLVTCNLDIRRFALDVIASCDDPKFLRACYGTIAGQAPQMPMFGKGWPEPIPIFSRA